MRASQSTAQSRSPAAVFEGLSLAVSQATHQANSRRDSIEEAPRRARIRAPCSPGPAISRIAWMRRCEASARTDVLPHADCLKTALSGTMRLVSWHQSRCARSADHARDGDGCLAASAITRFAGLRLVAFFIQRDYLFSPARALRYKMVSPRNLSASKACIGWASSDMT